jgi:hypothetical protein
MNKNCSVSLAVAVLLATVFSAGAQQPAKIPRIGVLIAVSPSAYAARIAEFRQGLRELGYVEGRNIVAEPRYAEGKLDRLPGGTGAPQGRHHRHGRWASYRRRQGRDFYDCHCHDSGSRSCCQRVRRQSCAARWKHHWLVHACPGAKRQTTRASQRVRPWAFARGHSWDFIPTGPSANDKRVGTRRKGVQRTDSISRCLSFQGCRDGISSRS